MLPKISRRTVIGLASTAALFGGINAGQAEAASAPCPICVHIVTTYDPDGTSGPKPPITRLHQNVSTQLPAVIDVDGVLPPLPIGIAGVAPFYELRTNVLGLDAETPRITLDKVEGLLATTPDYLPVRVEVVTGDPAGGWTTLGYDALNSNAPRKFVADVDVSDRDGNPATSQSFLDADITPTSKKELTVLTETFKGEPAGQRTERTISRLTFKGDGITTRVPANVVADLTSAPQRTRLKLTRSHRTKFEFRLSSPESQTTGSVDELPSTVDVTLTDVPQADHVRKDIDYVASAVASKAVVETSTDDTRTKAVIDSLPTEAHLKYGTPDNKAEISYHASGRAARAQLETQTNADSPLGDPSILTADVRNLPANIDQLTHTTRPDGGRLVYLADARADRATITTDRGDDELEATIGGEGITAAVPSRIIVLDYSSTGDTMSDTTPPEPVAGGFELEYDASDTIPHVKVRNKSFIEEDPVNQPAALPGAGHVRELTTTVDALPPQLDLELSTAGQLNYRTREGIDAVRIQGTDQKAFFSRAKELDVKLTDLPAEMSANFKKDEYAFDARGGQFGEIDVLAHDGSTGRLPADKDGVFLRDLADEFVIHGRIKGLRRLDYDKPNATDVSVDFDARSPSTQALKIDMKRDVSKVLYRDARVNPVNGNVLEEFEPQKRDGVETISGSLTNLPMDIHLDMSQAGGETSLNYTAVGAAGELILDRAVDYSGAPITVTQPDSRVAEFAPDTYPVSDFKETLEFGLKPVPTTLKLCRTPDNNSCTSDIFTDDMFEDYDNSEANSGSLRIEATPRTDLHFKDVKTERGEFNHLRPHQQVNCDSEVIGAPPGGGIPWCYGEAQKPMRNTTLIHADVKVFRLQAESGKAGTIGQMIGKNDQGYFAVDTGWRNPPGFPNCRFIDGKDRCFQPPDDQVFNVGHTPPPFDARFEGVIASTHNAETASEFANPWKQNFSGFGATEKNLGMEHGAKFGAALRVFEGDPDELIFAKHYHGSIYCDGYDVVKGGSSTTGLICEKQYMLPEGWTQPED